MVNVVIDFGINSKRKAHLNSNQIYLEIYIFNMPIPIQVFNSVTFFEKGLSPLFLALQESKMKINIQ